MALKLGGDRTRVVYTISKETERKVRELAKQTHRPMGQMLDKIVAEYELKED